MNARLRSSLLAPLVAVIFSALLCAVVLLFSGANPVSALGAMFGQLNEGTISVDIVNSTAIYMLAAIAAAIGFQMNLLNIGIEGQYRVGALVAAIVGSAIVLPPVLHWLVILLVAAAAGAAWATLPAILKVTRGVHEVLSTIMMNAIAFGLAAYLIRRDQFGILIGNNVSTEPIAESGQVPGIEVHINLNIFGLNIGINGVVFGLVFLSVMAAAVYGVMMTRTRFGFELKASGLSPTAAAAGGVNAKRMIVVALLTSGAVAGLVGMPEILGRDHAYTLNFASGYGFAGIGIALLGRNHPVGIAFGSLLWAFLDKAKGALDNEGVPREIATIMQGTIVLSVVVAYEIVKRMELAAEQRRVGQATGTVVEPEGAAK
ncbi:MAG: ABC transporter permease [Actinophytocola sp.]|uniref:ABC transporter permease n=1 Tax=Actinophytocola sp. TaxID=1872138 RepID=UPI003C78F6D0